MPNIDINILQKSEHPSIREIGYRLDEMSIVYEDNVMINEELSELAAMLQMAVAEIEGVS